MVYDIVLYLTILTRLNEVENIITTQYEAAPISVCV